MAIKYSQKMCHSSGREIIQKSPSGGGSCQAAVVSVQRQPKEERRRRRRTKTRSRMSSLSHSTKILKYCNFYGTCVRSEERNFFKAKFFIYVPFSCSSPVEHLPWHRTPRTSWGCARPIEQQATVKCAINNARKVYAIRTDTRVSAATQGKVAWVRLAWHCNLHLFRISKRIEFTSNGRMVLHLNSRVLSEEKRRPTFEVPSPGRSFKLKDNGCKISKKKNGLRVKE